MTRPPLPPNQLVTTRWPVIGDREPEPFDEATWRLDLAGLVREPLSISWDELRAMPHVVVTGTIHCVTRWSRPRIAFRGVPVGALLDRAGVLDGARFVRFASGRGHDTSLPYETARDYVIVADGFAAGGSADGPFEPIPPAHGGPVRTMTLARYLYKTVKWVRRIEVLAEDRLGFWERTAGYHNGADPWQEQRYVAASVDGPTLKRRLAERDLSKMDLRSADLQGADLAGANLRGASLRNANLARADLRGADLTDANCTNANLRGANLRDATIAGIDLDGADLRHTDLRGARGVPSSLAVTQFRSPQSDCPECVSSDGALVAGLTWKHARLDGLLPEQEAWLRTHGVV